MSRLHKGLPVLGFLKKIPFLVITLFFYSTIANCQDLEPRFYANLPKNINALGLSYIFLKGNVVTEPTLPIADFTIKSNNLGIGYVRTFALAKKLARVQVSLPLVFMSGKAKINGRDTSATRNGFADMRIRFGINLIGSPALGVKDFRK